MHKVVVTGSGLVTKLGTSPAAVIASLAQVPAPRQVGDYGLDGFDSARYLANKRVLRSVSWYQGFGLAAVELCKKDAQLEAKPIPAPRLGMYVGAPPSSMFDNTNYIQPVQESRQADGSYSEKKFGATCMNTLGTTLLLGLPNNVLCYGSMILSAKGPNSNYVSSDISGLLALCNGAWKIQDGKLDGAAVGGYSMSSDAVIINMLRKQKLLREADGDQDYTLKPGEARGTIPADGSVFLMLESATSAEQRGISPIATFRGAGTAFSGRLRYLSTAKAEANDADSVSQAIRQCLTSSSIDPHEIGLIFVSGSGIAYVDQAEQAAIARLQAAKEVACPVVSLSPVFGNLMEASGLLEVVVAQYLYAQSGEGMAPLLVAPDENRLDASKKTMLVVRSSLAGDKVCVAFTMP